MRLRVNLGMTQQQLSAAMGLGLVTVSRWETSRPPSGGSLARLALFAYAKKQSEIAAIFHEAIFEGRSPYVSERKRSRPGTKVR